MLIQLYFQIALNIFRKGSLLRDYSWVPHKRERKRQQNEKKPNDFMIWS